MIEHLGIIPIKVDLPFRLNHVNCFMAEGEDGWTIIDTGLNNEYTSKMWAENIQQREIKDIFITHYHPDHYGHSGTLQHKTGAEVWMSKIDSDAGKTAWNDDFLSGLHKYYSASGIPDEIANQMVKNNIDFKPLVYPLPVVNHYFVEGEKVVIGRYEYEIIFAPGHSDGMVCFYNKEKNVLLSADHILPRITPNISYWYHGDDNPLKSYLSSINDLKSLNIDYVIPSHGKPFHGANHRIDEIILHHGQRLEQTLAALGKPSSIYDVYQELFQFELTIHEIRFAVGETLAHLEYLRHKGECQRELRNGEWIYFL
ncbi:MBL fold metallo-hydrolase [Sporosarcina siberiensis]|uniref:MBL fold metallo-hydrolase n=1 Tax=Sporosarcina siberiensis TaxID=1365606 RepID=A0ABW4SGM1_9BACL